MFKPAWGETIENGSFFLLHHDLGLGGLGNLVLLLLGGRSGDGLDENEEQDSVIEVTRKEKKDVRRESRRERRWDSRESRWCPRKEEEGLRRRPVRMILKMR
jgi:hypothetical protein